MRHIYFTFICLFITAVSCNVDSDENIRVIKDQLPLYVRSNFDDPRSFKEIVEIIPTDTLSVENVKKIGTIAIELVDSSFVWMESLVSPAMDKLQNHLSELSYYELERKRFKVIPLVQSGLTRYELMEKNVYDKILLKRMIDSLKYEAPIYGYEVKCRIKENGNLKLKTFYAYVDSLSGFKYIKTEPMTAEDYSPQFQEIFNDAKTLMGNVPDILSWAKEIDEVIKY